MTAFTSFDQVLNAGALAPAPTRAVTPAPADFQPLFAGALAPVEEKRVLPEEVHGEPQIELVQENGRVQQIIVTCRCGERTVLDCAY